MLAHADRLPAAAQRSSSIRADVTARKAAKATLSQRVPIVLAIRAPTGAVSTVSGASSATPSQLT